MTNLNRYRSHKTVEAGKITSDPGGMRLELAGKGSDDTKTIAAVVDVPHDFYARGRPNVGDYFIRYEDGYVSWSPARAFEEGYTRIDDGSSEPASVTPVPPMTAADYAAALKAKLPS